MFVGVRFRDDVVVWLEEGVAGWREKVSGVEGRKFGTDYIVDGDVLSGGVAVIPFEVDDAVAGGPSGDVCCPQGCDKVCLPLS